MQGNVTSLRELQAVQDPAAFMTARNPIHPFLLKLMLYQKLGFFQAEHLTTFQSSSIRLNNMKLTLFSIIAANLMAFISSARFTSLAVPTRK